MSADCGTGSCEAETGSTSTCCPEGKTGCPCGTPGCSGDPIDCATGMWSCSFFQALKAAQVDALKAKMQKAWGAKMDKAADAVLEAMGVQWQSMLAQSQAKSGLREKLAGLWREGK